MARLALCGITNMSGAYVAESSRTENVQYASYVPNSVKSHSIKHLTKCV
jgi:hypothetical protein